MNQPSSLVATCVTVLCFVFSLFAQGRVRVEESGYAYYIEHGEATISDYKGPGGTFTVPHEVKGAPIIAIGKGAFYGNQAVVQVTIPDTVKNIDTYSFQYCSNLTHVATGNGVTNIAACAFYGCENLSTIVLSERLESIGSQAFTYCTHLSKLSIPQTVQMIGRHAFRACPPSAISDPYNRIPTNRVIEIPVDLKKGSITLPPPGSPLYEAYRVDPTKGQITPPPNK
ncbi:MAG TPA: leucine-rich repeat domain-containing protein [Kiritimatiellia bacterium]|nr:leucine-rich repeat domain-containing protein [Kiritimatiellia bacterium]